MKGFGKLTENNYVIKEDPSKHATLNQCWADVGPASLYGVVSSGHSFGGGPPAKTGH